MPLMSVTADELDAVLAKTPPGGIANKLFTRDEVTKMVDAK
jgi:ribose transport system substrate-binding protein